MYRRELNMEILKQILMMAGLALLLATTSAFGDKCQDIRGSAKVVDLQVDPCQENDEFYACYIQKVSGTLKGKWVSYQQPDWFDKDLRVYGLPVPEGSEVTWYGREFEVFTTKKGEVYGDAQTAFDTRIFDSDGGGALPTIVTGGSGIYEGATGWIVPVYTDGELDNFTILGRICVPNIPEDDDEN
jgi:hypothetical protein